MPPTDLNAERRCDREELGAGMSVIRERRLEIRIRCSEYISVVDGGLCEAGLENEAQLTCEGGFGEDRQPDNGV